MVLLLLFVLPALSSESAVTVDVHAAKGFVDSGHKYLDVRCMPARPPLLVSLANLGLLPVVILFLFCVVQLIGRLRNSRRGIHGTP